MMSCFRASGSRQKSVHFGDATGSICRRCVVACALVASVAVLALHSTLISAQSHSDGTPSDRDITRSGNDFDVVSIRPDIGVGRWMIGVSPDGYHAMDLPLWMTLLKAYFPSAFRSRGLIRNAPSWLWSENFDFVAKVASTDVARWNSERSLSPLSSNTLLQRMLQNALKERCKLVVHRAPVEIDGYALTLKHHGQNIQKLLSANSSSSVPSDAQDIPEGGKIIPGVSELSFYQTSMVSLADEFTILLSSPVIDKTGISGRYSFVVRKWSDLPPPVERGTDAHPQFAPQWNLDEIGLELKPIRVPVEALVIDHIERPSTN